MMVFRCLQFTDDERPGRRFHQLPELEIQLAVVGVMAMLRQLQTQFPVCQQAGYLAASRLHVAKASVQGSTCSARVAIR